MKYKVNVARNWKDLGLITKMGDSEFSEAKPTNTPYSMVIHEGLRQGYA